jgi:aspartyl/asparaginyl-tRNA synthetase
MFPGGIPWVIASLYWKFATIRPGEMAMAEWQRTHTCNAIREEHVGKTVTLNGWVLTTRNYPNQVFIDLRDRYGLTQVVVDDRNKDMFEKVNQIGREYVLSVTGIVRKRLPGAERLNVPTGAVELEAQSLTVLNGCPAMPFSVTEFPDEERRYSTPIPLSRPASSFLAKRADSAASNEQDHPRLHGSERLP